MAKRKLRPVDRNKANVEAERGETVITSLFGVNVPEHYIIEGEKHSKGGSPLNLPKDSFIFSNSKDLRITDPEILEMFDMPIKKSGYTPAEIAKKYDINKYKEILLDPNASEIEKNTATLMINNMFDKLSALALYQESMKGFPQGIPSIALAYMEKMGIKPEDLVANIPEEQQLQDVPKKELGGGDPPYNMFNQTVRNPNDVFIPEYSNSNSIQDKNPVYGLTPNPIANEIINTVGQTTQNVLDKFSQENLVKGPLQNDRGNFTTQQPIQQGQQQEQQKQNKKVSGSFVLPSAKLIWGVDTALIDSVASIFQRIEEKKALANLKNKLAGEENTVYTQGDRGDYVATGTMYGSFRPAEQTYAVNPMNIVTNKTYFDDGGIVSDAEKEKIAKTYNVKKDDVVVLNKKEDLNKDNYDPKKLYVYKDKGNIKILKPKYELSASLISEANINDKDSEIQKNAKLLIASYNQLVKEIDAKINEVKNSNKSEEQKREEIKNLENLKRGFNTNKIVLQENMNNEQFLKDYISNKVDFSKDERSVNLLETIRKKYPDEDLLKSKDDVRKFQENYNRIEEFGFVRNPYGFDERGMPKSMSPVDSWYGNTVSGYHALSKNMYDLKFDEDVFDYNKDEIKKPAEAPEQKSDTTPFFTQDIANLSLALKERAGIKKYLPYVDIPELFLPEATYLSPERQLAASQATFNTLAQAASALGTTSSFAALASLAAGQQMAQNANIIGNIHNQNIQIANQFDINRNQMLSQAAAQRANLMTTYYDKTTIANQQFDNAKREAERNIVRALNQAWTNRGYAQMLNKTHDYFSLDPVTFTISFDKDKQATLQEKKETENIGNIVNEINELNKELSSSGLSDDVKKSIIEQYIKSRFSSDTQEKKDDKKKFNNPLDMYSNFSWNS